MGLPHSPLVQRISGVLSGSCTPLCVPPFPSEKFRGCQHTGRASGQQEKSRCGADVFRPEHTWPRAGSRSTETCLCPAALTVGTTAPPRSSSLAAFNSWRSSWKTLKNRPGLPVTQLASVLQTRSGSAAVPSPPHRAPPPKGKASSHSLHTYIHAVLQQSCHQPAETCILGVFKIPDHREASVLGR